MMKPENINTIQDMQLYVEGCLNDFEAGISTKIETLGYLKLYTYRIIEIFTDYCICKKPIIRGYPDEEYCLICNKKLK